MKENPEARTAHPDGLLLVDKPSGITSHDVIAIARRSLAMDRIGHAGTLDPAATGLLLLLIGRATRLLPYLESEPKEYEAEITFGSETETDDAMGKPVREGEIPTRAAVSLAIAQLTGDIEQIPPAYSAKQRDGTRAYQAARRGHPLALAAASIRVHEWRVGQYADGILRAVVVCGGGTYVRSLARDLGRICGSAAHLSALRRTKLGSFSIETATKLHEMGEHPERVLPPLAALPRMPRITLSSEHERMIVHGRRIPAESSVPNAALIGGSGNLIAVAQFDAGEWKPKVVLVDA